MAGVQKSVEPVGMVPLYEVNHLMYDYIVNTFYRLFGKFEVE